MMATRPDLVRDDLIVDGEPPSPFEYDVFPVPLDAAPKSGVFWKATRASQAKGQKILSATTQGILQVIQKEFKQ
jgi:creatinine amidohydrolase/Fe(II)-dependent formamide hydrolase-like protein